MRSLMKLVGFHITIARVSLTADILSPSWDRGGNGRSTQQAPPRYSFRIEADSIVVLTTMTSIAIVEFGLNDKIEREDSERR